MIFSLFVKRGLSVASLAFLVTGQAVGRSHGLRKSQVRESNTDPTKTAGWSNCFSGMNTVEVLHKGTVALADIQIGDFVKDAAGDMVRVYGFGPYQPRVKAEFLQIFTEGIPKPLEISKRHMVFVEGNAVPASTVQVGAKLDMVAGQGVAAVVKIRTVVRTGIYTPFTTSGTIMVNGIAASNYVMVQEDADVLVLGGYSTPLSTQWVVHLFHALPRMLCSSPFPYCRSSEKLLLRWAVGASSVGDWIKEHNWVVALALFVPLIAVGLMLYLLEAAMTGNAVILVIMGAAIAALHVVLCGSKKSKKLE